jgi:hypothetical protein
MTTMLIATTAQEAAAGRKDTFTLIFPRGEIAFLEVRGAISQESARAIAEHAFTACRYAVIDGDQAAAGQAQYFYSWSCTSGQKPGGEQ